MWFIQDIAENGADKQFILNLDNVTGIAVLSCDDKFNNQIVGIYMDCEHGYELLRTNDDATISKFILEFSKLLDSDRKFIYFSEIIKNVKES